MRVRGLLTAWLFVIAVAPNLYADDQSSGSRMPLEVGLLKQTLEKKEPKATHYEGHLRIEGMQYLSPLAERSDLNNSELLSARIFLEKDTNYIDFITDTAGGTFFTKGQSHMMVHEAYMTTHGEEFKVLLGRKKKNWSELDERWSLGLWQPVYALDALRPEEEGLTGLFATLNQKGWEFVAFTTPVNIPNMGLDIREDKGGLAADSRWYRPPSRAYDFNNNINMITYKLNIPDQLELVKKGGSALMGRIGSKEAGPWMVLSAGYLPVNELILKRAAYKSITTDKIDVTVTPEVTYHALGSVDLGYSFGSLKTSLSYLEDDPREKLPDQDMSIQKLKPIQAYAAAVDFSLAQLFFIPVVVRLEYLKVNGGAIQDITSEGTPDSFTMFDTRLKFNDATQIKLEGQLGSFMNRPLVTRLKYLYDYDQRGSLLNTEFLFYPSQEWAVVMGGDVLGVTDENYRKSGFLNEFRANDRVYGGMTYVF